MRTAIIIPAYNEGRTIARVVAGVARYGLPIVVDDASTDDTGALAAKAGAEVVVNTVNRGYDGALQRGFERAEALGTDIAVTFDADGQHNSDILDRVLRLLQEDKVDLIIGIRPSTARPAEWLFNCYGRWRYSVGDLLCGVKAYRMSLYRAHGRFDGTRSIGTELAVAALRRGVQCEQLPVSIAPREGPSRFGPGLKANWRIFRALIRLVAADLARTIQKHPTTTSSNPGEEHEP